MFTRVPAELNWESSSSTRTVKKRKLDDEAVAERLAKLEAKEKVVVENEGDIKEEEEEEDDVEKKNDDDEEPFSDDDYLEEDNDYVHNYFDNGEGGDSDDNLEDGDAY
uniref:DNA-directed RNA polymerase III subunit RPC7 n=3 Tax=Bursaphelenchus xylophilus TaxID=6326 RepID=A0A1I7S1I2_BURXY